MDPIPIPWLVLIKKYYSFPGYEIEYGHNDSDQGFGHYVPNQQVLRHHIHE